MNSGSKFSFLPGVSALAFATALWLIAIPQAHAQAFNVVYSFTGSDGANPVDGFTADGAGNLYATTFNGGAYGHGVIFKITSGQESVLYSFQGGTDGANPEGGVLLDSSGNLYGTTTAGGAHGLGTVYKVSSGGQESVLYSFAGGKDGATPKSNLVIDSSGDIWGTTTAGGVHDQGTIFRLWLNKRKNLWYEQRVHVFGDGKDGQVPVAGVFLDAAGNAYGTTSGGGEYGYGTVYELERPHFRETILWSFKDEADGAVPYAGVIADSSGNLYGAATEGGEGGQAGGGTIFELAKQSTGFTFSVIYPYPGWGISGSFRSLLMDSSGNLYGSTHCDGNNDSGTVYELSPSGTSWNFNQLYLFSGGSDGQYSFSNPVLVNGVLYGTTQYGGANGAGVVWSVTP
jgi:uncharacterized repeat protein (TIGR03803 family)